MALLTLEVPDELMAIPQIEQEKLIRMGLEHAILSLINHLKKEIHEIKSHILPFEHRYQMTFSDFELNKLPQLTTLEAHDDYNDWFFWQSVWNEKWQFLAQLKKVSLN